MTSGILLALIAGLFTFRAINDAVMNATSSAVEQTPTIPVLVAAVDIPARRLIDESMITVKKVPANLVPEAYIDTLDDVIAKMATVPIAEGEILLRTRLVDPTDKDAPILYRIDEDEVLVAVPASALMSSLNLLSVGDHVDLAYTVALEYTDKETEEIKSTTAAFLSLQNLEVKGLVRSQPPTEEGGALLKPDAVLLAVRQQDALVLKYLIDIGASMDFFLRPPGVEALSPTTPVDAEYLVDRFQLFDSLPDELVNEIIRRQQSANDTAEEQTAD
ncbi:MAG: Flp pilus assembly protein CpaB [Gammaproteobacteria bacterium]|nr:MAG: Flp pilus assembly protein CpaB [Gammaproteobacteria bacterium]